MKETVILLMTILLFCSCNSRNRESNNDKQLLKDFANMVSFINNFSGSSSGDSIPPTKIDGLRALSFKFNVDSSGYLLKTINIYSDNKQIQRIIANKEIEHNQFQLIDWNFDGYKDFINPNQEASGAGGEFFNVYLFNPAKHVFEFSNEIL